MPIAIAFIIIALLPTVAAWRKWLVVDQRSLAGTRKILFTTGLCIATLALLEYLAFALYTNHVGGFGTNFPGVFKWTRPGFWASVLALLLVLTGRGKCRVFGLSSGVLMVILWIIPDWGM
jgi:hypothetical protein